MSEEKSEPSVDRETGLILLVVCGGLFITLLATFFSGNSNPTAPGPRGADANGSQRQKSTGVAKPKVSLANVPLATGDEPIQKLFIQSGCAACHTIPGILAAKGREGPRLTLGVDGPKRLEDPNYHGTATTVREYIMESILTPGAYVVEGYPDRVMPRWYGKRLSAAALDKIIAYLERVTDS